MKSGEVASNRRYIRKTRQRDSHSTSNQDALDLVERDLIVAAVVEAGCTGRLVIGHLLRHFELAAVPQVLRDPGRAKAVTADFGAHASIFGTPADHAVSVCL